MKKAILAALVIMLVAGAAQAQTVRSWHKNVLATETYTIDMQLAKGWGQTKVPALLTIWSNGATNDQIEIAFIGDGSWVQAGAGERVIDYIKLPNAPIQVSPNVRYIRVVNIQPALGSSYWVFVNMEY